MAKKNKLERFTLKSVLAGLIFSSEAFPSGATYCAILYGRLIILTANDTKQYEGKTCQLITPVMKKCFITSSTRNH
jgi:hypothetical protein